MCYNAHMKTVSVITICFNSEAVIEKTIKSVLSQTYPKVEYVIIDGASKDGTVALARSYEAAFAEKGYSFRVISEPDKGIYDAMNKGIRNTGGEIVGIINSGDWYEPEAVETAAEAFEKEGCTLFFADINLVKENGSVIVKHSKYDSFPTSRHWNHPTMFTARSLYDRLGLYSCEGIHDDFEFYLRVRRAGEKIYISDKILANFATGGASNAKSFKKCYRRCMDRYKAYRKNGYPPLSMLECVGIEAAKFILS